MADDVISEKYISFVTFRKTGVPVGSPTWVVPLGDGRVGFYTSSATGKVKRLKNNPAVTMQASNARGKTREGAPVVSGTAVVVASGPDFDAVQAAVKVKYGFMTKVTPLMAKLGQIGKPKQPYADRVVVVTPS